MPLTPEQLSDFRAAMAGAPALGSPAPTADRRNAQRISQQVPAEVYEWHGDRAGRAFHVLLQDLSTEGVGIVQSGQLKAGSKYLMEIPRPQGRPLSALFTVVRCDRSEGGLFHVQLEPDQVLDVAVRANMLQRGRSNAANARRVALAAAATLSTIAVAYAIFTA